MHKKSKNLCIENEKPMHEKSSPNWLEIEQEYILDISRKPCTLKDLSAKYQINYEYIRRYAAEHNWSYKRKNNVTIISQRTVEKTVELISNEITEMNLKHFGVSDKIINIIAK